MKYLSVFTAFITTTLFQYAGIRPVNGASVNTGQLLDAQSSTTTGSADVMDASAYKDVQTSRGLNYHYYFSPPSDGKPFLVFLHGFPSTSYDWHKQVPYFQEKGYGLIVPDLLGYGGTAKPLDPAAYRYSLTSKDVIDILDAEEIETAVFIGHDWGALLTSRIVQYHPDRVIAFGVLAVGYQDSFADFNWEASNAQTKEAFGYELFGYWEFFSEDGADKLIEAKFDKFFNLGFPENAKEWITDFAPVGALKRYLTSRPTAPPPSWISKEERRIQTEVLLKGGFAAPLNYYKVMFFGIGPEDDKGLPRVATDKPAFFGAASEDYVARVETQVPTTQQLCSNLTLKEFQSNHWVQLYQADEVNRELGSWLESVF
ncbi:hypothetical protein VNI00_004573 [Paramarasmius palmivorus]|uniref:AB hydrolase-1 domain-containing protein n=1 Tax=Paramarasmius palmivorus TaxID=297713 RepID=A0AAW0DKJ9_9AGAR